jgi:hypothetical protein
MLSNFSEVFPIPPSFNPNSPAYGLKWPFVNGSKSWMASRNIKKNQKCLANFFDSGVFCENVIFNFLFMIILV